MSHKPDLRAIARVMRDAERRLVESFPTTVTAPSSGQQTPSEAHEHMFDLRHDGKVARAADNGKRSA